MPQWILYVTAAIAIILSAGIGFFLVPYLHKLHFGQPIKVVNGPKWHEKKKGTPTMGGFMFIIASIVAVFVGYALYRSGSGEATQETEKDLFKLCACVVYCFLFGMIGFTDDFIKVAKKHNLGLKAWQKIVLQVIISAAFLFVLWLCGDRNTDINLSFVSFNVSWFYYPIMILVMIYLTNAVNLTDGIDGLCGSVTVIASLIYMLASMFLKNYPVALYSIAIAGACLGFLYWNFNPAKCFMGDTGSMYLGAYITATGIMLHRHLFLILVALVYILEALSVVIQVAYFKYTKKKYGEGKRIFKMTPIHHHFELSGFSEYKICFTFSLFGAIAGVIGLIILVLC